jgi:signal transduction histidine kinase
VIAFILDITNRKLAEEHLKNYSIDLELQVKNRTLILEEAVNELERTKMELKEALEKEKELNELKSRFVSMASHEFRTPLATILSSLSLVKKYGEQQNKEDQDRHIVKIKSAINNLTDILNDFLSVSRLEEGKIECKPEYTNVREFIEDMAAELFSLRKEGMQFQMEHFGNEIVFTDPKLLKNIFFNLISNAIKFSNENSVIKITSSISDSDFSFKN